MIAKMEISKVKMIFRVKMGVYLEIMEEKREGDNRWRPF